MKVTAIIEDDVINAAMRYSKSTTVTNALKVALKEYLRMQRLKELSEGVKKQPLNFNYSAEDIRNVNREL